MDFFYRHAIEHLALKLGLPEKTADRLVRHVEKVASFSPNKAIEVVKKGGSPSAKQIADLLELGKDEEQEEVEAKQVDQFEIKQHDYRPLTTHSPQNEPSNQFYSLLALPSGQPAHEAPTNAKASMECMPSVPLSKKSNVINSIEISDEEKKQAVITRKKFEAMLDSLHDAFEHLNIVNGALADVSDPSSLEPLRKLFKQYRRKIQTVFNEFIDTLEVALLEANKTVSDSEMERIEDTIVAEIREIRDGAEKLLVLLKEPQDPKFVSNFTEVMERLNIRRDSLSEIVTDQLFEKLDYDVLAKVRLG